MNFWWCTQLFFNYDNDKEFNRNAFNIIIYISIGAEAGILESKGKLEKRSKKYSLDYKIVEREGDWFIVQDADGQKKIKAFRNSCN